MVQRHGNFLAKEHGLMMQARTLPSADDLKRAWKDSPRWRGVTRGYSAEDVVRLRGTVPIEHSIARITSEKLWHYLNEKPFVNALGALTGNQAMQQVKAGLDAIYLSGWQVAGDANLAGQMYPDQSLYPADSVPAVVRHINSTLRRADELHHAEGDDSIDWLKPIVADAEAGFGGVLNAFELMKAMIEAGAAAWAARCWCRPRRASTSWWRRGWRLISAMYPRYWWRAPMRSRRPC
jgi:isocitrate lyase